MDEKILSYLKDLGSNNQIVVKNSLLDELCDILYNLGVNAGVTELSDDETLIFLD